MLYLSDNTSDALSHVMDLKFTMMIENGMIFSHFIKNVKYRYSCCVKTH